MVEYLSAKFKALGLGPKVRIGLGVGGMGKGSEEKICVI